jgi:hypothetical protein
MKQWRVILLLYVACQFQVLRSQGATDIFRISKGYSTFQVGAIGSVDMCYRTLENKKREPSIDNLIQLENENQTFKFGYHAGIGFCINASKHFGMETGVIYSNRGYETKLQNFIYSSPEPGMPTQGRSIYNYNYIDVPLKANFFAGNRKVRFYCSVGVVTNILISQNETFVKKYEDGHTDYQVFETNWPFERVVFSGTIAAGIDVKFTEQLNLRISPNFSHNIGRFMDAPISGYLWNAGLSAEFYFGWYN